MLRGVLACVKINSSAFAVLFGMRAALRLWLIGKGLDKVSSRTRASCGEGIYFNGGSHASEISDAGEGTLSNQGLTPAQTKRTR